MVPAPPWALRCPGAPAFRLPSRAAHAHPGRRFATVPNRARANRWARHGARGARRRYHGAHHAPTQPSLPRSPDPRPLGDRVVGGDRARPGLLGHPLPRGVPALRGGGRPGHRARQLPERPRGLARPGRRAAGVGAHRVRPRRVGQRGIAPRADPRPGDRRGTGGAARRDRVRVGPRRRGGRPGRDARTLLPPRTTWGCARAWPSSTAASPRPVARSMPRSLPTRRPWPPTGSRSVPPRQRGAPESFGRSGGRPRGAARLRGAVGRRVGRRREVAHRSDALGPVDVVEAAGQIETALALRSLRDTRPRPTISARSRCCTSARGTWRGAVSRCARRCARQPDRAVRRQHHDLAAGADAAPGDPSGGRGAPRRLGHAPGRGSRPWCWGRRTASC